jgi:hypothetical protein
MPIGVLLVTVSVAAQFAIRVARQGGPCDPLQPYRQFLGK